jgi:hypothetical protein
MENTRIKNQRESWCSENWWIVGVVIGLVGLIVATGFLLGVIGGASGVGNKSNGNDINLVNNGTNTQGSLTLNDNGAGSTKGKISSGVPSSSANTNASTSSKTIN